MGNRKWVSLGLAAALLVFGAGVAVGKVTDAYRPTTSGQWGFVSGNTLYGLDPNDQLVYVAGVWNAYQTVVKEALQMIDNGNPNPGQVVGKLAVMMAMKDVENEDPLLLKGVVESYLPVNVTIGQLRDVVAAYLRDHPAERQNNGALLVWRALAKADWK